MDMFFITVVCWLYLAGFITTFQTAPPDMESRIKWGVSLIWFLALPYMILFYDNVEDEDIYF